MSRIPTASAGGAAALGSRVGTWRGLAGGLALLAWCGATLRAFRFVDALAVNVPYWDQWDLWRGLFEDAGPWALWRQLHGPQRQGLGGLVVAWTAGATRWNARADAFVCTALVAAAAGLGLILVRRLRGRWLATDGAVAFAAMSLGQHEVIVTTTNPSHGPLPLLLAVAAALGLTIRHQPAAAAVLGVTGILAGQTGFAYVLAALVGCVLAVKLAVAIRRCEPVVWHAVPLVATAGSLAVNFVGFHLDPAVPCFTFPDPQPVRYIEFLGVSFARSAFMTWPGEFTPWLGVPVFAACLALAAWAAWRTLATGGSDVHASATFVLAGFTLAFAAVAAVGRVCLGPGAATASRYVPYLVPFLLSAYAWLTRDSVPGRWRMAFGLGFIAVVLASELGITRDIEFAIARSHARSTFAACYRSVRNAYVCNAYAPVYPDPFALRLDDKVRFLEARGLSFFAPESPSLARRSQR